MLTEEQINIISEALRPLYNDLEQAVITDVARRIAKTSTFSRTAEIQAKFLKSLGYSPSKIRSEALKILRADADYRKEVARNTIEYKKWVQREIDRTTLEARLQGDEIIAKAGNMSWVNDLSLWKDNGIELTDSSFLGALIDATKRQTRAELVNLTRSSGFKTISGFESIESLYQRELDKAEIKLLSGAFSQEKVIKDVVHTLSASGLRSIDYASGRSFDLNTAVSMCLRTGASQLSAEIQNKNIDNTGQNLVYVEEHANARNTGVGVANHEEWQGKVYYINPGTDYTEEAKRIGQSEITDLYDATGYSIDGKRDSNPLGLHGYNCRHIHMVWFEGASTLPPRIPKKPEVIFNGKKLDGYAQTQEMRKQERAIRNLKKEKEALSKLGEDTTEISKAIEQKTREYKGFCRACSTPANSTNLRYETGVTDLKNTQAYKDLGTKKPYAKAPYGHKDVHYNPNYDYSLNLEGYSEEVNKGLSLASHKVAELGEKTRTEHMYLVDLKSGELAYYETNGEEDSVGYNMYKNFLSTPLAHNRQFAFVHNHNSDTSFSESDMWTLLSNEKIPMMCAIRNDAIKYVAERKGDAISRIFDVDLFPEIGEILQKGLKDGSIETYQRARIREELYVNKCLENYTKGGVLIEYNGQR